MSENSVETGAEYRPFEIEPVLVQRPRGARFIGGFRETACWDVQHDGEVIGQVWRGEDYRQKVCWMLDVPFLRDPRMHRAVIGGYSRTSRKGAVAELVEWHVNRTSSTSVGDGFFHCARIRKSDCDIRKEYFAEFANGVARWVYTSQVIEARKRMGIRAVEGWYADVNRGTRFISALYCASEEEALSLIVDEAGMTVQPDERNFCHPLPIEFHGSLSPVPRSAASPVNKPC